MNTGLFPDPAIRGASYGRTYKLTRAQRAQLTFGRLDRDSRSLELTEVESLLLEAAGRKASGKRIRSGLAKELARAGGKLPEWAL